MKAKRGFTLIEVMISSALVIIVAALASALLISAGRVSRNSEVQADAYANARAVFSKLGRDVSRAGYGASKGLYAVVSSAPQIINPVASYEGLVGGTDDLWLVVPRSAALDDVCPGTGGLPWVKATGTTSPLSVNCSGTIVLGDTLLVSNYDTAAIVTVSAAPTASTIPFAEGVGYASMPNGFQLKDSVIPAELVHYSVVGSNLLRTTGSLNVTSSSSAGQLFDPATPTSTQIIAQNVEDFQVRFYYGLIGSTAADTKLVPTIGAENLPLVFTVPGGNAIRSVEVAVSIRSASRLGDSSSSTTRTSNKDASDAAAVNDFAPKAVFNHTPTATPDGFYRTVMSKRFAVPNLQPGSL